MTRHVHLHRWASKEIAETRPGTARRYTDPFGAGDTIDYEQRAWTSDVVHETFDVVSAIASWTATTPDGSWLEVSVREGAGADWLTVARWAETDDEIHRTTVPGQATAGARAKDDEVVVDPDHAWHSAQVRVSSMRRDGGSWPEVTGLALALSGTPTAGASNAESPPAHLIDVPPLSQQLHRDELPDFGGGGQNWCSPTSVSMVLAHWGVGPAVDPVVPYAATQTYDHAFGGAGNWAFNTAYAGRFGLTAFVTRLRSLDEAARLTAAGVPVVLSVAFTQDELDGAGYDTSGHLVVLTGFDESGDPVVNDPASHTIPSLDEVRTTYDRGQLERAWLEGSGGVVYVIRPAGVPLPAAPAEPNW